MMSLWRSNTPRKARCASSVLASSRSPITSSVLELASDSRVWKRPWIFEKSWLRAWKVAVPYFVGIFGKGDPLRFAQAGLVEEAEFYLAGIGREEREVHAIAVEGRA